MIEKIKKLIIENMRFLLVFFLFFATLQADEPSPPPQKEEITSPPEVAPSAQTQPDTTESATDELKSLLPEGNYKSLLFRSLGFIGLILLLVFVTIFFVRRLTSSRWMALNHMRHIKILERRPLSSRSVLYLVELGGKQILIAESQLEVRSLTEVQWPDDAR